LEGEHAMTEDLQKLIEAARKATMSAEQWERQRRSFAYGNAVIENSRITREMVDQEAEKLAKSKSHEQRR
jgi:hypothetical protein